VGSFFVIYGKKSQGGGLGETVAFFQAFYPFQRTDEAISSQHKSYKCYALTISA
jgi:hypothetical protein